MSQPVIQQIDAQGLLMVCCIRSINLFYGHDYPPPDGAEIHCVYCEQRMLVHYIEHEDFSETVALWRPYPEEVAR